MNITLNIQTTTGGSFSVLVDNTNTVENLKKIVAKKLKVAKDRICLLHRERELQDGTLKDNGLVDGSKIILTPNVETGLLAQRAENTVMQALESLNDTQVNDFLSGKSPLNLSVRLGDHMMLIQLQLSTLNPGSSSNAASSSASTSVTPNTILSTSSTSLTPSTSISSATARYNHRSTSSKSSRSSTSSASSSSSSSASTASSVILLPPNSSNKITHTSSSSSYNKFKRHNSDDLNYNYNNRIGTNPPQHFHQHHHHHHHHSHHNQLAQQRQQLHHLANQIQQHDISTYLIKQEMENIQNMVKSLSNDLENKQQVQLISQPPPPQPQTITKMVNNDVEMIGKVINSNSEVVDVEEQSPIKSLSNLVSSPIKTTSIKNISSLKKTRSSSKSQYHNTDPITANLTSCLCSNLDKTRSMNNSLLKTSPGCIDLPNCQLLRSTRSSSASSSTASTSANSSHRTTLHRTANNPIVKPKHRSNKLQPQQLPPHLHSQPHIHHQHFLHNPSHPIHHHHHNHQHQHQHQHHHHQQQQLVISQQQQHQLASAQSQQNLPEKITYAENLLLLANQSDNTKAIVDTSSVSVAATPIEQVVQPVVPTTPEEGVGEEQPLELQTDGIDNPALAEASRNLTQTLRKLSKRVFTNKIDVINESSSRSNNNNSSASSSSSSTGSKIGSGAVIESMKHHGKGIYSGTFSGTLNPALQDKYGRPKRDISTIIHILNDLLSAAPQCARSGAKIVFEPTSNSLTASSTSTSTNVNTSSSRHYSSSSRSSSRHSSRRLSAPPPVMQNAEPFCQNCNPVSSVTVSSAIPTSSITASSKVPCSSYGKCNGHYYHHHHRSSSSSNSSSSSSANMKAMWRNKQQQQQTQTYATDNSSSNRNAVGATPINPTEFCTKCSVQNTLELENNKTKLKLDHLRLVMQQKKERREARKLKSMPYNNPNSNNSSNNSNSNNLKVGGETVASAAVNSTISSTTPPNSTSAQATVANTTAGTNTVSSGSSSTTSSPVSAATVAATNATTNVGSTTAAATTISTSISNQSNNTAQTTDVPPTTANNHLAEEVDTIG